MRIKQRDTAVCSYHSLIASGEIQEQEKLVLFWLSLDRGQAFTRKELARLTGLELSAICGRVNALIKRHLVEVRGIVQNKRTRRGNETLGVCA